MKIKLLIVLVAVLLANENGSAQTITTIAGADSIALGDGGPATAAKLVHPYKVCMDGLGNIYIAERDGNRIRKINSAGIITTIAGTGASGYSGDNGPATSAKLNGPGTIAFDHVGNIYIGDYYNYCVRKIDTGGIIRTIAGTGTAGFNSDGIPATAAQLSGPSGLIVDSGGNVYISDEFNHRIRKIGPDGIINTIVGTGTPGYIGEGGPASAAQIDKPYEITLDSHNNLYIADWGNHVIRRINSSGIITTVAGNGGGGYDGDGGQATNAKLNPTDVAVDQNNSMYIADPGNNVIRKVNPSGIISTIAGVGLTGFSGDGGPSVLARLNFPVGVTLDNQGNIYVADFGNGRVRFITSAVFVESCQQKSGSMLIYPNPCRGHILVNVGSSLIEAVTLKISTITGVTVFEITGQTNKLMAIDLDLQDGMYVLSASTLHETHAEKIIVAR